MKKTTKVLLVAVLVLMLVLPFTAKREKAYAAARKPEYLTDSVGVISGDSAKMIEEEAKRLQDKYGASVYSVIQDNYSGDIDDYAYDLFKKMGFETQDNCDVVLFIFEDAGEYWALQGLGIEHELDSERLSSLLANYFASAFSDYHTDKAILNFIDGMDLFYKDFFSKQNNPVDDTVIVDDFGKPIPNNGCYNCGYNCASCGLNCGRGCLGCGIGCGSCLTSCLRNCAYNCGGYGYGCGSGLGLFSCLTGGAFGSVFIIAIIIFIVIAIFGSIGRGSYGYGYRPRPNFFFFGGPRRPRGPRPGGFGGGFGGPRHGGFGGPRPGGFGGSGGSRPGGSHGSSGGSRGAGGKR